MAMKSSEKIFFYPKEKVHFKFKKRDFVDAKEMLYSQKIEGDNPFKNDIGLTLFQVRKLREKLQLCQKNKKCPAIE